MRIVYEDGTELTITDSDIPDPEKVIEVIDMVCNNVNLLQLSKCISLKKLNCSLEWIKWINIQLDD